MSIKKDILAPKVRMLNGNMIKYYSLPFARSNVADIISYMQAPGWVK
jgi:hypothetical protein